MHNLTKSYEKDIARYEGFRAKAEVLIKELLVQNSIKYHKIESRIKEVSKLDEKIIRKGEKYSSLQDITDLVGLRIITYFEDEVDKIANLIETEFVLDASNSVDKRTSESDRFGYKSLHYVVSLNETRKNLMEYKRFKDLKIEVQIRSILQHAWAEIEHDIGYKGELAIPESLKRNFYRAAALLETVDIEFVNIKNKLYHYEQNVSKDIKNHPENVDLNSASLSSFIELSQIVKKTDGEIAKINSFNMPNQFINISGLLEKLNFLNIKTIKDLEIALFENKTKIAPFSKLWFGDDSRKSRILPIGISIFYLCYVLVGKNDNLDQANEYYADIIMKNPQLKKDNPGKKIIDTYKKI